MTSSKPNSSFSRWSTATFSGQMLHLIAYYLVPLAILFSIPVATLVLDNVYPASTGTPLAIRTLPDTASTPTAPSVALPLLDSAVTRYKGDLSGAPSWFLIEVPAPEDPSSKAVLNVANPYTQSLSCWDAANLSRPLGTLTAQQPSGQIRNTLQGPEITLEGVTRPGRLLCSIRLAIPEQVSADLWDAPTLIDAKVRQARAIGLAEGGLLTLALFIAIISLTTGEALYILLAAWLVGTLRMAAWAMGWDMQWLGHAISLDALPALRKATLAA
ncbi:MAG TPA: hypothetical protein VL024_01365, partial [Castellaniella sp.]|nr:hypothetical protein [Castellaniella sp.]